MALDIFVPYWGDAGYMKETVASVLAQTSADWKLTVVDDAYPDPEIGRWMGTLDDPRISYIRKESNEGITANYRTCVGLASEPVMVMVGCDDRLLPNYVDDVLQAHERFPNAAVIQPRVQVIDENGTPTPTLVEFVKQNVVQPRGHGYQLLSGEHLATSLLHGDWLYWPALAFRTDVVQRFDFREGFPLIQDLALVLDMVFAGEQMLLTPNVAFEYRRHRASASSATLMDGTRFAGERRYFDLAATQADDLGWRRAARAARLRWTSRAHAGVLVPQAALARDIHSLKTLLRHTFGS